MDPKKPDLRDPLQLMAFGFGSGLAPKAPGTFGSLAAVALFPLLALLPIPGSLSVSASRRLSIVVRSACAKNAPKP